MHAALETGDTKIILKLKNTNIVGFLLSSFSTYKNNYCRLLAYVFYSTGQRDCSTYTRVKLLVVCARKL